MKTLKFIIHCISVSVFFYSCSTKNNSVKENAEITEALKWTSGNYTFKSNHGNYFENWEVKDSVTWLALGYFMDPENEDTLFRQRIKLQQTTSGIFMYFNVKNQNDNKTVEFKMTNYENRMYTFENPFRDYPAIITYKFLSDTSINVVMHGFKNGEERGEDFIITKRQ